MTRLYFTFILLCSFVAGLQAQTMVTFQVDMSLETPVDTVSIAGSFQAAAGFPADWTPGATLLTDANMDNVYDVTVSVPAGSYQFKYINGTAWGQDEGVPGMCANGGNREVVIGASDTTLDVVCFGKCIACPSNVDTVNVTFQVDMSNETVGSVVSIAGSFQGQVAGTTGDWKPGETVLTDANSDGIYDVTVRIAEGTYQYKFLNGDAWGTDESIPSGCAVSNNREITITDNDSILVPVCFGTCVAMCVPPLPAINVTFRVDMQDEILSADGVFVAGSFQNPAWEKNTDVTVQSAANSDIHEFTVSLVPGEYQYLFFNGDYTQSSDPMNTDFYKETGDFKTLGCGADNGFGGSNRVLDIVGQLTDTVLPAFKYNTCEITVSGGVNTSLKGDLHSLRSVQVYPNPFSGTTTVTFSNENNTAYQVDVVNMAGQVVRNYRDVKGEKLVISAEDLTSGMYFLTIRNAAGEVYTEKLVVK